MRTTILPTDPNKRKAWAAKVAQDSAKDQYFSRMEGEEGTNSAVIRKTDLEAGAGDEVTTALVAKLRGTPIIEGQKLEGKEFRLQHAAHTMRINEFRHGVNVGARIEQSRVGYNLKKQGREKLTDYIAELYEEVITTAAAGTRGVGAEVQHLPLGWAGYPNAYRAPDAAHYFAGDGSVTAVGNITAAMKANLGLLETLPLMAKKMLGGQPDKASKMQQVIKGGKKVWLFAAAPEVIKDIRADSGAQGWWEAQRALTTAIGKEADLFQGGAGLFNGVLVDEMETCVKLGGVGNGGANITRALFLGANAVATAHGTKGIADGMTVGLSEDTDDRGHDSVLDFEIIFGADKPQFNSMDYGLVSVDLPYMLAPGATL
jgi:N4-gp56 family major capsid protein